MGYRCRKMYNKIVIITVHIRLLDKLLHLQASSYYINNIIAFKLFNSCTTFIRLSKKPLFQNNITNRNTVTILQ